MFKPSTRERNCPSRASASLFSMKAVAVCFACILMLIQWMLISRTHTILTPATVSDAPPSLANTDTSRSLENRKSSIRSIANAIKLEQIENYKVGKALLVNVHATHHAGTTFCNTIGRSGGPMASARYPETSPRFVCYVDTDKLLNNSEFSFSTEGEFLQTTPVSHEKTDEYVNAIRPHFHMTSWEYHGVDVMRHKLSDTNWEHPNLVSVLITRDPLSRLLATDQIIEKHYKGFFSGNLSHSGWWDFASNPNRRETSNFFLRIIDGTKRKDKGNVTKPGEFIYTEDNLPSMDILQHNFDINESHYKNAVSILDRFTVVLDIACLDDGLKALVDLFGLNRTFVDEKLPRSVAKRRRKKISAQDRIGYQDVYEYLLARHQWDIKLYEYSKTISLVNCDMVGNTTS